MEKPKSVPDLIWIVFVCACGVLLAVGGSWAHNIENMAKKNHEDIVVLQTSMPYLIKAIDDVKRNQEQLMEFFGIVAKKNGVKRNYMYD